MTLAETSTAKNHSAEVHRRDKRDAVVQCATCGAVGTVRLQGKTPVFTGPRVIDGKAKAIEDAITLWHRAEARSRASGHREHHAFAVKAERAVRDARSSKPVWLHESCGGEMVAFDINNKGNQ